MRRHFSAIASAVATAINQFFCGLSGHAPILKFEPTRLFVECMSCGYRSPGWDVTRPVHVQLARPVK